MKREIVIISVISDSVDCTLTLHFMKCVVTSVLCALSEEDGAREVIHAAARGARGRSLLPEALAS